MKIRFLLLASLALTLGSVSSAWAFDAGRLMGAGANAAAAITVTDEDLIKAAQAMRALGDRENKVAPGNNPYNQRLAKIMKGMENADGLKLNFKVYLTNDVNANASPDGSIRVYSGLMDLLNDDELFFVLGHEIGHVKDGDVMDAMRVAYIAAGGREAAAAAGGTVTVLSDSILGDILEAVINAQFSQSQESAADVYGYNLLRQYKRNQQAGVTALQKIDQLGLGGSGGLLGLLSSHPNAGDRAKAIADLIAQGK
ncbi:MAG: M48 family metalloprotease [Desulfarculales bacterium]|jgi:putative metalloprotease|nr:M48 family metalloprotease [Desulfarculales bacterium]